MALLVGIGLTLIFGYSIALVLAPKLRGIEILGIGYALGLAWVTLLMFYLSLLNIPLSAMTVGLSSFALAVCLMLIVVIRRRMLPSLGEWSLRTSCIRDLWSHRSRLERILAGLLATVALLSLLMAVYWPPHSWDELAIYDFAGRVFSRTQNVDIVHIAAYKPSLQARPLLEPLANTWLYLLNGSNPRILYWLLYGALLLSFYGLVRVDKGTPTALTTTLVLASTPVIFRNASVSESHLPTAVYFSLGILYLDRWFSRQERGDLRIGAVMLALMLWARPAMEPFFIGTVAVFTILCKAKRLPISDVLVPIVGVILVNLPWYVYRATLSVQFFDVFREPFLTFSLASLYTVLRESAVELMRWERYGFIWLLLGVALILNPMRVRMRPFVPIAMTMVVMLMLAAFYLTWGDDDLAYYIPLGADRLTTLLIPLVIYWAVPAIGDRLEIMFGRPVNETIQL